MKYTLLFVGLLIAGIVSAQTDTTKRVIYTYVEQMPTTNFDMPKYLTEHLHYPDTAVKYGVEGRVIVKFLVQDNGRLSDIQVIRGIGAGCDEEAVRVLKSMPPWNPGKQNGKPVNVYFTMPFIFRLQ